jgi:hypothetical protein
LYVFIRIPQSERSAAEAGTRICGFYASKDKPAPHFCLLRRDGQNDS